MSSFKEAIDFVNSEVFFDDSPIKKGLTLTLLRSHIKDANLESLNAMSDDDIESFLFEKVWHPNDYSEITSQCVANKLFDTALHIGSFYSNKILKKSISTAIFGIELDDNGILDRETISLINNEDIFEEDDLISILKVFSLYQKEYYASVVSRRHDQAVNLSGWLKIAGRI